MVLFKQLENGYQLIAPMQVMPSVTVESLAQLM
jgi:hypothetical protein